MSSGEPFPQGEEGRGKGMRLINLRERNWDERSVGMVAAAGQRAGSRHGSAARKVDGEEG